MSHTGPVSKPNDESLATAMAAGDFGQWSLHIETGVIIASDIFRAFVCWPQDLLVTEADLLEVVCDQDRSMFIDRLSNAVEMAGTFQLTHRIVTLGQPTWWADTR